MSPFVSIRLTVGHLQVTVFRRRFLGSEDLLDPTGDILVLSAC